MAFVLNKFQSVSTGLWHYKNTDDSLATIAASNYFFQMRFALNQNDIIFIVGSDGVQQRKVTSTVNTSPVTTALFVKEASGIESETGMVVEPGSDKDVDLIRVDVTGQPTLSWKESASGYALNTSLLLDESNEGSISHTIAGVDVASQLEVHSEGSENLGGLAVHRHTDSNNFGSHLIFFKSGGTHSSPTVPGNNDTIARLIGTGYDGTDYEISSEIRFRIDGTPGNNDMPGDIAFYTNGGSQTATERMTIAADGVVNVAGNITVGGTVDGRDLASDGSKLDNIEANADVTDETNVVSSLDGATLTSATVATGDKVLVQDADDSDNLKTVTAQSIADLGGGGGLSAATQSEMEAATSNTVAATPGTTQYHPGVAKVWALFRQSDAIILFGGASALNISSLTDNGNGDTTLSFTTSFSSGGYSALLTHYSSNDTYTNNDKFLSLRDVAAGSLRVLCFDESDAALDDRIICLAAFGDQ